MTPKIKTVICEQAPNHGSYFSYARLCFRNFQFNILLQCQSLPARQLPCLRNRGRSPQIIAEYRQRLEERVKELLGDTTVDEGRLLTEVTIFADKVCVDEELVRLRSHIETTKNTLTAGGSIGRKLDFLAQEMNREANTILSKSNDLEISNCAIELKTEIEKVREQIQNIE